MEHDNVAAESCDRRLFAEPPGTPTHSTPSFSLRRRARGGVGDFAPARLPDAGILDRSDKAPWPTQPQEQALLSLAGFPPWKVAAWVEIVRSLKPGYQHIGFPAPLTSLEFNAVNELKDCEQGWLLAWLNFAAQYRQCTLHSTKRGTGLQAYAGAKQPSSTAQSSPFESIANPRGYSPAFQPWFSTPAHTSASSLHPSSALSRRTVQRTLRTSLSSTTSYSQPSATDQGSPTSSKTGDHLHWCNICENPKEIGTCDGYKKHMKEHETICRCMPNGPVKFTKAGTECYFCGAPNPDQSHLDEHHVSQCSGQSYTRKGLLSQHIKDVHIASESYASALAKAWYDPNKNNKEFFSCGFCICYFNTRKDISNHIDMKHWRQHQELKQWNNNTVILGLLLRPGVKEAWEQLLKSARINLELDPHNNQAPQWPTSVIKHVQLQLEIREGSAPALARLAFEKSSYYSMYQANISNGTLQPFNEDVNIFRAPPMEQNSMSTMQLPSEESLEFPGGLSTIDPRRRVSHGHQNDSCHENAPDPAQILHEMQNEQLPSTAGLYENIAISAEQVTGFHNHSNPFLDPLGGTMGDMFEWEAPSSSPWSPYTASQKPDLTQGPMLSEVRSDGQASFDAIMSGAHMDTASGNPHDQPEDYMQHYGAMITETLSSSVHEGTHIIPSRAPARRKSRKPIVIGGPKRKPSSSPTGESRSDPEPNPIVVEMGRGSVHEDRCRGRKRIEGYNSHY